MTNYEVYRRDTGAFMGEVLNRAQLQELLGNQKIPSRNEYGGWHQDEQSRVSLDEVDQAVLEFMAGVQIVSKYVTA